MSPKIILVGIVCLSLLSAPSIFAAENDPANPSLCDTLGDALWIRPLGFLETAVKALGYVVSLPVTKAMGTENQAKEFLIEDPYNFYFKRPLGQF